MKKLIPDVIGMDPVVLKQILGGGDPRWSELNRNMNETLGLSLCDSKSVWVGEKEPKINRQAG